MTQDWTLEEALAYYRRQGAPGEQGALVALLREVQEERGGALPAADLAEIAAALSLRDTFLSAIIRRYPGLRTEEAPHRLELCGGPRCSGRGAARLAAFVEETYGVRPGGVSASGRFTYRITGCMKNCPNGPSLFPIVILGPVYHTAGPCSSVSFSRASRSISRSSAWPGTQPQDTTRPPTTRAGVVITP